jgi:hypothetical protein
MKGQRQVVVVACLIAVAGSSLALDKANAAAPAAEVHRNGSRTPIPLSPQPWQVPSDEVLPRNRAPLTRNSERELLGNPGFEKGGANDEQNPRGWGRGFWTRRANRPEVAAKALARSSERAHRGRYSLRVDASFGDDDGAWFVASQQLPIGEIKGKSIRYTLWSYVGTHPHPEVSPIRMRVRQWLSGEPIQSENVRVPSTRGRWHQAEIDVRILDTAEKVDVAVSVDNTHYSSRPTVVFIDDMSVTLPEDELLVVTLPIPEQERAAGVLPIQSRVADDLRDHAPFVITHLVRRGDTHIGGIRLSGDARAVRGALSLGTLPPGNYQLSSLLSLPKLGPVAIVHNDFVIYEGPFDGDH